MSLDAPKICESCGENVHGYGHRPSCRANRPELETERCSKCGANTAFEWDELEGWTSVCCTRPPKALPADAD